MSAQDWLTLAPDEVHLPSAGIRLDVRHMLIGETPACNLCRQEVARWAYTPDRYSRITGAVLPAEFQFNPCGCRFTGRQAVYFAELFGLFYMGLFADEVDANNRMLESLH